MTWRHVIRDPYEGVDWANDLRLKASLHTHTTQSDGAQTPAEVIDRYHSLGYKALALTDHDSRSPGIEGTVSRSDASAVCMPTWPWTDFGRDPAALGMVAIQGNEPSWSHHIGSYFNDTWRESDRGAGGLYATDGGTATAIIDIIGQRGGLAQMAHPGRDPFTDETYVSMHETYPHLVGHEVYNRNNLYPEDKPRWDRLLELQRSMGLTLPIWGWSVDDSHGFNECGYSYHVHLAPAQTEAAFRTSLEAGAYWFVNDPIGPSTPYRHVNPSDPDYFSAAPVIHNIDVRDDSITIYATGHTGIDWVSDGVVVASGATLSLDTAGLGLYVRAEMEGDNGSTTHTQPWYLADGPAPQVGSAGWAITRSGLLVPVTAGIVRGGAIVPIGG